MKTSQSDNIDAEKSKIHQEKVEISSHKEDLLVVTLPYTVSNPRTVMVEMLDTVVAIIAMRSPRRTEYLTGSTKS